MRDELQLACRSLQDDGVRMLSRPALPPRLPPVFSATHDSASTLPRLSALAGLPGGPQSSALSCPPHRRAFRLPSAPLTTLPRLCLDSRHWPCCPEARSHPHCPAPPPPRLPPGFSATHDTATRHWQFCVLPGVIPAELVDSLRESVVSSVRARHGPDPRVRGDTPTGNSTFINVNQDLATFMADPRVLGVVQRCFGPVPHSRVGCTSCVIHEPPSTEEERSRAAHAAADSTGGGLHVDWPARLYQSPMWSTVRGPPSGDFEGLSAPLPGGGSVMTDIQAFFLLTDYTYQNGAIHVLPGSHHQPTNPNGDSTLSAPDPAQMQIVAGAGSVVLCDGRLYHSGGTNFSDAERVFCGVKYVPFWLNLHCRRAGSAEALIQAKHGPEGEAGVFGGWPFIRHDVYCKNSFDESF